MEALVNRVISAALILLLVFPALSQQIAEPKSGEKFAAKDGDQSLLGVGLRTKTIARVKVYAIALYAADAALAGPLKGKNDAELYRELVNGDFQKKVVMKFLRDVSAKQIQDAFRESLKAPGDKAESWLQYFGDT